MRPSVALWALAALLVAPGARAFCRTTTVGIPAGYDPSTAGCWTQGIPLAWPDGKVPYGVVAAASKQVPLADATRLADLAFGAWNAARCSGGQPGLQAFDDGPIAAGPDGGSCASSATCDAAAHNVIVFDDASWPHSDPSNTLALTTVTYGVDDGRIFEAYTEVNTAQHQVTAQEPPPAGSAAYDLQAILTHEAGHFFGLAHATEKSSIMYAFYSPGAVKLTADDTGGFCAIYPTPAPGHSGCALGAGPASAGGLSLGIAALSALGLARRRRRAAERSTTD